MKALVRAMADALDRIPKPELDPELDTAEAIDSGQEIVDAASDESPDDLEPDEGGPPLGKIS